MLAALLTVQPLFLLPASADAQHKRLHLFRCHPHGFAVGPGFGEYCIQLFLTAVEALALSIGEKARVDMEYMSRLTGKDEETLFSELTGVVFLNPAYPGETDGHEKYLPADEYLSGNVRQKWAVAQGKAEQDPQYQINADALAQVQPTDLTASEISVRLGATWLDTEYLSLIHI